MGKCLCTQDMLDDVISGLKSKGRANVLPAHVLMIRPLEPAPTRKQSG
jgi:hypothetical protein